MFSKSIKVSIFRKHDVIWDRIVLSSETLQNMTFQKTIIIVRSNILSPQKKLSLQDEDLFSLIVILRSWTFSHWKHIPEYDCWLRSKNPWYALMLLILVVEKRFVDTPQRIVILVEINKSRQFINTAFFKICSPAWTYEINVLQFIWVINVWKVMFAFRKVMDYMATVSQVLIHKPKFIFSFLWNWVSVMQVDHTIISISFLTNNTSYRTQEVKWLKILLWHDIFAEMLTIFK